MYLICFVFFLSEDVGDHNFCRNPDGSEKPWCYVSGSNGETRKEACDIKICQGSHVYCHHQTTLPVLGKKMAINHSSSY